jgi:hypothetical protein
LRPFTAALALLLASPGAPARGEEIAVQASAVALNPADPSQDRVGSLAFRGGLVLRGAERRFGGLSDLVVSADRQRLAAVSDEGSFVTARLLYDPRGFLSGIDSVRLQALCDTRGKPIEGKPQQDAESLVQASDGSFVVGFEHWHRIWRYAQGGEGRAEADPAPPGLDDAPDNGGLETLVLLDGDRLLALTEQKLRNGVVEGWLRSRGRWEAIGYRAEGPLRPSGGCRLSSGDLLIVERHYARDSGITARLRRVPAAAVVPGAVLDGPVIATLKPPLTVDNFEGLACLAGEGGETLIYLLTDDNFSAHQRTLLLMFALKDGS